MQQLTNVDSCEQQVGRSSGRHEGGTGGGISLRRKVLFAVVTTLGLLMTLEVTLRFIVDESSTRRFSQINQIVLFLGTQPSDLMLEYDPMRFWKLKPNVVINDPANTFWQGRVSNSMGYRCPEFRVPRPTGVFRIVCFGDSSTFGIGAPMEATWPYQLQQMLQTEAADRPAWLPESFGPETRVEVINAGVPGYTSWQGLQHMRQEIDRLQPHVVFASYANNDFWHWDHRTDRQHAVRLQTESGIRRYLMQFRTAGVFGRVFDSMTNKLRDESTDLSSPNQHWAAAATWNYKEPRGEWIRRVPLDEFHENISAMADLCRARRVRLILVKWPDQPQTGGRWSPRIEYQEALDAVARQRGLSIADVVELFQQNRNWSVHTYVPDDIVHVNAAGNRLAALAAQQALWASALPPASRSEMTN